jgi:hypothetical protein
VLKILSFVIGRVRFDEIGNKGKGGLGIACNGSKKLLEVRRIIQQG